MLDGKSVAEIAEECGFCVATVNRVKHAIRANNVDVPDVFYHKKEVEKEHSDVDMAGTRGHY